MAKPPPPRNSHHRPSQEDRKEPGRNYGGPRRDAREGEQTDAPSPVSEIFADPRYQGTWAARTDARAKAERGNGGVGMGGK